MRTISKLWENFYLELDQVDPKNPRENSVIKRTMRPKEYRRHADKIIKELNPQDSVLEIGCGFGGLALEMLKLISVKYTVVDNEPMLLQAKKYLGDKVEYIEAEKIETLQDRKFGLFISNFCLSETPPEYRKYILENIIKNCQKIFIIDHNDEAKPTTKMLRFGYEMLPLDIGKWVEKYFIIKKSRHRKNLTAYIGERKE